MLTVAIIGAGDLGGAIAHALAGRDRTGRVLLVDPAGTVAAGKAMDIQQMGAVAGFHTHLDGTDDSTRAIGASVFVIADRYGKTATEWRGDEGATMVARLLPYAGEAPIIFAGASQEGLLVAAVRDAGIPRHRVLGSAPAAFASAVAAIVAVEARCSPGEVALTVRGAPGSFVVPWSEASIGGYALERVLSQVQLTKIEARAARLWPPGPYTLGAAAARVAEAILDSSRASFSVLTVLDEPGDTRVGALPARLAPHGIAHTRTPTLNTREQLLVETSLAAGRRT